ncbi:hypothetical protein HDU90_008582 [Geranomyces variabilis]|nr:hypothetical protein HDU90_008582 [Geranomyces variabilis]
MLAHTLAVGLLAAQLTGIAFTFLARTPPHPRSERARWALAAIGVFFSDMPALVCMVDTVVLLLAWRCGVLFDTGVVGRACAAVGAVLLVLLAAVFVEGFVVTRGLVVRVLAGVQKHGSVVEGPEVIQRSLLWR